MTSQVTVRNIGITYLYIQYTRCDNRLQVDVFTTNVERGITLQYSETRVPRLLLRDT